MCHKVCPHCRVPIEGYHRADLEDALNDWPAYQAMRRIKPVDPLECEIASELDRIYGNDVAFGRFNEQLRIHYEPRLFAGIRGALLTRAEQHANLERHLARLRKMPPAVDPEAIIANTGNLKWQGKSLLVMVKP